MSGMQDLREELRVEVQQLTDEKRALEADLSNRNRVDATGRRMTGAAYWSWRHDAIRRKDRIEESLAAAKGLLRNINDEMRAASDPKRGRNGRIEAKLDLLLAHFKISVPREVEAEPDTDQHGTPWDDAMTRRLPGSFESGRR